MQPALSPTKAPPNTKRKKLVLILVSALISLGVLITTILGSGTSYAATSTGGNSGSEGVAQAWSVNGLPGLFYCVSPGVPSPVNPSFTDRGYVDFETFINLNLVATNAWFNSEPDNHMAGLSYLLDMGQTSDDTTIAAVAIATKYFVNSDAMYAEAKSHGYNGANDLAGITSWYKGSLTNAPARAVELYNNAVAMRAGAPVSAGTVRSVGRLNPDTGMIDFFVDPSAPGGTASFEMVNMKFPDNTTSWSGVLTGRKDFSAIPVPPPGQADYKVNLTNTSYTVTGTGGYRPMVRALEHAGAQTIAQTGGPANGSDSTDFEFNEPLDMAVRFAPALDTRVPEKVIAAGGSLADIFIPRLRENKAGVIENWPQEPRSGIYYPYTFTGEIYKHPEGQAITRQANIPAGAVKVGDLSVQVGGTTTNPVGKEVTVTSASTLPNAKELASGRYTIVAHGNKTAQILETRDYLDDDHDFVSDYGIADESFLSPPKITSRATTTSGVTLDVLGKQTPVTGITLPLGDTIIVQGDVIAQDGYTIKNTHYTFADSVTGFGHDAKATSTFQAVCDASTKDIELPAIPLDRVGELPNMFTADSVRNGVGVWVHTLYAPGGTVLHVSDCSDTNQWSVVVPPKVESRSFTTTDEFMNVDDVDVPVTGAGLRLGDTVFVTGILIDQAGYELDNTHYTFKDTLDPETQNPLTPKPEQIVCDQTTKDRYFTKKPVTREGQMDEDWQHAGTSLGVGVWQHKLYSKNGNVLHTSDCADTNQWTIVKQVLVVTNVATVTEATAQDSAKLWGTVPPGSTIVFELFCKKGDTHTVVATSKPGGLPGGLLNGYVMLSDLFDLPKSASECDSLYFMETTRNIDDEIISKGFPEDPRETITIPNIPPTRSLESITVRKSVVGEQSDLIPETTVFTIAYSYVVPGETIPVVGLLPVPVNTAVRVENIPTHSVITFSEPSFPVIDGVIWGEPTFIPGTTSVAGTDTEILVENMSLTPPTPGFEVTKTSNPPTGSVVTGGDEITYTVTGTNTGNTVLDPVILTDNLTDVLKHAVFVGEPHVGIIPNGGLVEEPAFDETSNTLSWVGMLQPGQTVTLTYTVKLDERIMPETCVANVVTGSGTPPGEDPINPPEETTKHCTPPVASFAVTKELIGDAAFIVPEDTVFTVTYSYTHETLGEPVTGELVLRAGETLGVKDIPLGALVSLIEVLPVVDGVEWGEPVFNPGNSFPITTDHVESALQVTLTNQANPIPVSAEAAASAARLAKTGSEMPFLAGGVVLVILGGVFLAIQRIKRNKTS